MKNDIPRFDPSKTEFVFNNHYDLTKENEARLYLEVGKEATWKHGEDVIFIKRKLGKKEPVFGEFLSSSLEHGVKLKMHIYEKTQWGGAGNIFSKFGFRTEDEVTLMVPKESCYEMVATSAIGSDGLPIKEQVLFFPKMKDLIFFPNYNKLFEISLVDDEVDWSFWAFGNKPWFQLNCALYVDDGQTLSNKNDTENIPEQIQSFADNLRTNPMQSQEREQSQSRFEDNLIDHSEKNGIF